MFLCNSDFCIDDSNLNPFPLIEKLGFIVTTIFLVSVNLNALLIKFVTMVLTIDSSEFIGIDSFSNSRR